MTASRAIAGSSTRRHSGAGEETAERGLSAGRWVPLALACLAVSACGAEAASASGWPSPCLANLIHDPTIDSEAIPLRILAALATIALGSLALLRPASLRRPSFWLATLFLLQISWAAAIVPSELSDPLVSGSTRVASASPEFVARLAGVCFPLAIAMWLALTPPLDPGRWPDPPPGIDEPSASERATLAVAIALSAVGVAALLSVVPISETGLWGAFESPDAMAARRESTFKLLPSAGIKAAYGFATTVAIPLAVALLASRRWLRDRGADLGFRVVVIALLVIAASLSGARSTAAFLVILIGFVMLVRGPLPRLRTIAIAGGTGLALVALMSVLPWLLSAGGLPGTSADSAFWIARRAFSLPFQTGLWHLHYAATHGHWGFDGFYIPLRTSLGGEYADPSTVVGRWYAASILGRPELTTTMNTSVLWMAMASFGAAAGFILATVLALASDLAARIPRRLPGALGPTLLALLVWQVAFGVHSELVGRLFSWGQQFGLALTAVLLCSLASRAGAKHRHTPSGSSDAAG